VTDKRQRAGWRGYLPAIVTPFTSDHSLDLKGLAVMLEWLHAEQMHGLVIAGTTGEWTSLSGEERKKLFSAVGAQMRGKLPLIAGCTAFTAREVVEFAEHARVSGFDGALVAAPPYIRPSEEEIYGFYTEISARSTLPICVYNWPPGTGIDLSLALLERLATIDNVVAIKQSTSNLRRFVETFFALREQVLVFGHSMDEHGLALLEACGGDGTMGAGAVLGRVHPDFYNHLWAGRIEAARLCGRQDRVIHEDWYLPDLSGRFGSGPSILKAALNLQGLPGGYVRPPLHDVSDEGRMLVRDTLVRLGRLR
jgi:dihydrodipicolinate synthase/N-acetylneuraminate lyase